METPLGSGAMGDVYKGYRCSNGDVVAIKKVKDAFANNKMIRERARQEASLAFRHPNLVEMIGYCEYAPDSGPIFILSHFVQGEDIDKYDSRQLTSYRISPDIYAYYILINTKGKDEVNNIKLMYETEEECDEYLDELTYEWERTLKEISKCI